VGRPEGLRYGCPWKTPNSLPAIVTTPARASPVFGATVTCTAPLPDPDAGPVNVTHGNWLVAVHAQVGCDAVTVTGTVAPTASNVCASGAIENVHGGGAAACVTVNV